MRISLALALAAIVLAGCAAQQQQARREEAKQAFESVNAELDAALAADRKLDPIRTKVSWVAEKVTLQQLSLSDYPTAEEKLAIDEWQGLVAAARPKMRSVSQQYYPYVVPLLDSLGAAGLTLASDLYSGKLTFGQYNRQRLDLVTRFREAVQRLEADLRREQLQAAQVQAQQSMASTAALGAFQNYLLQQQLINQQYQPARIAPFSCTRFGNTTSCY